MVASSAYNGGSLVVQYSANNTNFTDFARSSTSKNANEWIAIVSVIVPPWFVKFVTQTSYTLYYSYTIQKF